MPNATCAAVGCDNSYKKLRKWRDTYCPMHKCRRKFERCNCSEPFRLFAFPREPEAKLKWEQCVYRKEATNRTVIRGNVVSHHKKGKNWKATLNDCLCSKHFVDGVPTPAHPYPTVNMGHNLPARSKKRRKSPTKRQKTQPKRQKKEKSATLNKSFDMKEASTSTPKRSHDEQLEGSKNSMNFDASNSTYVEHSYSVSACQCVNACCIEKQEVIVQLRKQVHNLEYELQIERQKRSRVIRKQVVEVTNKSVDVNQYIANDKQVVFYTGVPSVAHFNHLYEFVHEKVKKMRYWI